MLYHERGGENKKNANFVYIVYLLTKLSNIFDEAFFIDVSILLKKKKKKKKKHLNKKFVDSENTLNTL